MALLFALGSLRIAIQRADVWHITLPFIPLLLAFLWPTEKQVFKFNRATHHVLLVVIAIASITRLFGLLPTASFFGTGLLKGARDVILEQHADNTDIASRRVSIQTELTEPDEDIISLANYLAQAEQQDRPVIFYGNLWWLGTHTGVCPTGYSFYQLMYTDGYKPITATLEKYRNTLIVIAAEDYHYLFQHQQPIDDALELTLVKKLATWLSSIHYRQKVPEKKIKREIWQQNVGNYVAANYQQVIQFGDTIVLERR